MCFGENQKKVAEHTGRYKNAIISILRNLDLSPFYFEVTYVKNNIPAFVYQGKHGQNHFLSQITKVKHFLSFFFSFDIEIFPILFRDNFP